MTKTCCSPVPNSSNDLTSEFSNAFILKDFAKLLGSYAEKSASKWCINPLTDSSIESLNIVNILANCALFSNTLFIFSKE